METKFTLITRHIGIDKFWKRSLNNKEEAIKLENILTNRDYDKHEIVGLIKEKKGGHRWCLSIKNKEKGGKKNVIFLYSKKSCILATKLIRKYNNNLDISYTKSY